jgi:hypothetical protein
MVDSGGRDYEVHAKAIRLGGRSWDPMKWKILNQLIPYIRRERWHGPKNTEESNNDMSRGLGYKPMHRPKDGYSYEAARHFVHFAGILNMFGWYSTALHELAHAVDGPENRKKAGLAPDLGSEGWASEMSSNTILRTKAGILHDLVNDKIPGGYSISKWIKSGDQQVFVKAVSIIDKLAIKAAEDQRMYGLAKDGY